MAEPLFQRVDLLVVGHVDLDGYDRNITVFERPLVRVGSIGFIVLEIARQPVVISAARILATIELLFPVAFALSAYANAFDLFGTSYRNVYVETEGQFDRFFEDLSDHLAGVDGGRLEIGIGQEVEERKTDRGHSVKTSFDSGSHCAGIEYADGRVCAMIDSRYHQIYFFTLEQVVESHLYAVYRSSGTGIYLQVGFFAYRAEKERRGDGDGVRHARLRCFGSDDQYSTVQTSCFDEVSEAFGIYAVVVGDEYEWFFHGIRF